MHRKMKEKGEKYLRFIKKGKEDRQRGRSKGRETENEIEKEVDRKREREKK